MARVWPTDEAMDEQLARELGSGAACVLGESELTWDGLIDAVLQAGARHRPIDPVSERLALRRAAARVFPVEAAGGRGLLAALSRALGELRRAGVGSIDALLPVRARRVLAVYDQMTELCRAIGASRDQRRGHALADAVAPVAELELQPRLVWEPADVELVLALARRAHVRVSLPWAPDRSAIYAGIEDVLRTFEARGTGVDLELVFDDPAERGCARGLVAALHRPGAQAPAPRGDPPVAILSAPHPAAEARALAARVRALVQAGVAPEEVAIAVRQPGGTDTLVEELERAGLHVDQRFTRPLGAAPPVRLALALLGVADRGWPREEVLGLLGSAFVDPGVDALACARLARSLGLRELSPTGEGLRRMATLPPVPEHQALASRLRAFLDKLAALPELATVAAHASALRTALHVLGVPARARAMADLGGPAGRRIERAVARDGEAVGMLDALLARLPLAADEVGLTAPMPRRAFAALLADLLEETRQRPGGARGGAVRIVLLQDLAARAFDHVLVAGLVDGNAPARAQDDGVWGERERREVNGALGRRALPTAASDTLASERTSFETLLLVNALASARHGVVLSYPRSSGDRPLERSPFLDEVVRAAPWVPVVEVALSPVPPLRAAAAPADVIAAIALEALGDVEGRLPPRPRAPDAHVLLDELALVLPERVARLVELAGIERARWRFFAGVEAPGSGPWVGQAGPRAAARAGGGPEAPVPARKLEELAGCPFTFFAGRVLGAQQAEETADAPSALSLGNLAHRCLELFYRRRAQVGAFPLRADEDDRAVFDDACATVFAAVEAEGVRGHPLLWRLGKERLLEDLWRTVTHEAKSGDGAVPTYFELPFGLSARGGPSLPALELAGLCASGRIDRVDVLPGGHRVIDYKLGRNPDRKLRDAGETELQLPIYAAAVKHGLGAQRVDAAYVSVRDGVRSRTMAAALGEEAATELLEIGLTRRFAQLGARLRSGAFEVAPADESRCTYCTYRMACRVVRREHEEETP